MPRPIIRPSFCHSIVDLLYCCFPQEIVKVGRHDEVPTARKVTRSFRPCAYAIFSGDHTFYLRLESNSLKIRSLLTGYLPIKFKQQTTKILLTRGSTG